MRSPVSVRSRQRLRTILTILVTALIIAPAAALATHSFTDVDDREFFHAAVDWMKANGVTVGCNPPENTMYCPDEPVTRGELAVFLERLDSENVFLRPGEGSGGDGGDADTLDGKDSTEFLGATEKATDSDKLDGKNASAFFQVGDSIDADTLDGKDSTEFLGANAKAADSDLLDGNDSTAFATSDHDHRETVTRIDSCAGPGFRPDQDAQTELQLHPAPSTGAGWLVTVTSGVGDLLCDPDLPDGAVITGFTAHLWDNDDSEGSDIPGCWLRASSTASPGTARDVAFAGPTSGGGGLQVVTDDTVTHTVDTGEWFYFYHCGIPTSPQFGLVGVKTTYTIIDVPAG